MKLLKLLPLFLFLPLALLAQDLTIKEANVKMGKSKLWCFSTTYKYDKAITAETIEGNIERANFKRSSHKKGFNIYRGVSWPAISNTRCDYYYKVKSKKGKTTVYFSASKGYDNFVTSANDPEISGNIKTFLQNLDGQIANALAIKGKEQELKSIEEKNEVINKQLEESKKQEAAKAQELQKLKRAQAAPAPVK